MKAVDQIREFAAELVRAGDDAKKQHGGKQPIAYLANAMISHGRAIGDIANLIPNDQEEYAETVRSLHERLYGKDMTIDNLNETIAALSRQIDERDQKITELVTVLDAASLKP